MMMRRRTLAQHGRQFFKSGMFTMKASTARVLVALRDIT
jgi:hypothetical protein